MKQPIPFFRLLVLLTLLFAGYADVSAQLTFPKQEKYEGAPIKTTVTVTLLMEDNSAIWESRFGHVALS